MQVLTSRGGRGWRAVEEPKRDANGREIPDEALSEISRNLSDCFRCSNLVVLTGLGTSLHVNRAPAPLDNPLKRTPLEGKAIAPMMRDLWSACKAMDAKKFEEALKLARYPVGDKGENIESLLSYCKLAEDFIDSAAEKAIVASFIKVAEEVVRDQVRFLKVDDDVGLHADFLRRLVRRSTRKLRTKVRRSTPIC